MNFDAPALPNVCDAVAMILEHVIFISQIICQDVKCGARICGAEFCITQECSLRKPSKNIIYCKLCKYVCYLFVSNVWSCKHYWSLSFINSGHTAPARNNRYDYPLCQGSLSNARCFLKMLTTWEQLILWFSVVLC